MHTKQITIQGIAGSFHDIAARSYFSDDVQVVECPNFNAQFETMAKDASLYGMLAIENTVAGSILPNYRLLCDSDMFIIGEHKMHISQNLVGLPGQKIEDIEFVESHPMAIRQSEAFFLKYPHIKMVESDDTASSARRVAALKRPNVATICGQLAADIYNLEILAPEIETNTRNFTRFLVLQNKDKVDESIKLSANKCSLMFSLPHKEGSLSKILSIFSFYDINLTKVQSMPDIGHEWRYLFYVDFIFDDYARYKQAIEAVLPLTTHFKILGEYIKG